MVSLDSSLIELCGSNFNLFVMWLVLWLLPRKCSYCPWQQLHFTKPINFATCCLVLHPFPEGILWLLLLVHVLAGLPRLFCEVRTLLCTFSENPAPIQHLALVSLSPWRVEMDNTLLGQSPSLMDPRSPLHQMTQDMVDNFCHCHFKGQELHCICH